MNATDKRGLFWKEWREHSAMILWMSGLTIAFFAGDVAITGLTNGGSKLSLDSGTATFLLVLVCFLSAGLNGSAMVSPEIGSGTLAFLTSLPVRRRRIWWSKVLVSLLVHLICVIAAFFIFVSFNFVAHHLGVMPSSLRSNLIDLKANCWITVPATIGVFAVAIVVTMLFDRTLSAMMVTVFGTIALIVGVVAAYGAFQDPWSTEVITCLIWLACLIYGVLLFDLSYMVFVQGESLRTNKRLSVMVRTLIYDAGLVCGALILAIFWLFH